MNHYKCRRRKVATFFFILVEIFFGSFSAVQNSVPEPTTMADDVEDEDQQIFEELASIPVIRDAYTGVWNAFERLKGRNFLLKSSLGLSQITLNVICTISGPAVCTVFKQQLDKLNKYSCCVLNIVELMFPMLREPTDELLQYGRERFEDGWVYTEPLTRPVRRGIEAYRRSTLGQCVSCVGTVAGLGLKVFRICMWPVLLPFRTGLFFARLSWKTTSFMVRTGIRVSIFVIVESVPNATWEQIQQMLSHLSADPPEQEQHERRCCRTRQLEILARGIQGKLVAQAQDFLTRCMGLMGVLLTHILDITTAGILLTIKKSAQLTLGTMRVIVGTINRVWDWCEEHLSDRIPQEQEGQERQRSRNPLKRAGILLRTFFLTLGEMLNDRTYAITTILQGLGEAALQFIHWCQMFYQIYSRAFGSFQAGTVHLASNFLGGVMELMMAIVLYMAGEQVTS